MNTKTTLAILAIATVAILVSSTAIAKPALASNNKDNSGHSVSKSDLRGVGNFLKCISNHGGNDISKSKAQKCVDNNLG